MGTAILAERQVDTHCYEGYSVPPYYDSLLAKLIVYGLTREEALGRAQRALHVCEVEGIATTIPFLESVLNSTVFEEGQVNTLSIHGLLEAFSSHPSV